MQLCSLKGLRAPRRHILRRKIRCDLCSLSRVYLSLEPNRLAAKKEYRDIYYIMSILRRESQSRKNHYFKFLVTVRRNYLDIVHVLNMVVLDITYPPLKYETYH